MMTRDKVEQAADVLMKHAVEELSKRQERLERRKQSSPKPFSAIMPAAVAAIATASAMSFLDVNPVFAAVFGGVFGWTIGGLFSAKQ